MRAACSLYHKDALNLLSGLRMTCLCFLAQVAISKHHREGLNNTHLFFTDLEAGHSEKNAVGLVSDEACSGLAHSCCLAMSSHRKEHVL